MKTRRNRRNMVGIAIFIGLVVVSGLWFNATNNIENPFKIISNTIERLTATQNPPAMTMAASTEATGDVAASMEERRPPEGEEGQRPAGGGHGGNELSLSAFNWDLLDGVLFNLWFICAVTAVVMLIGTPIGKLIKRLKQIRPVQAASS